MTHSAYSNNFLKLIYLLTTKQQIMTPNQIQAHMQNHFLDISPRTILRWYKFLKEQEMNDYSFDYFPYINFYALGLQPVTVIFKDAVNEDVLRLIPHIFYGFIGRTGNFEKKAIAMYLIPPNKINQFKEVIKEIRNSKLISDYHIFFQIRKFIIYTSFHKIFDEQGNLKFEEQFDNDYFVNRINLKQDKIEMIDEIKKEPFIIPILFEQFRESWSSHRLWTEIQNHLGNEIWNYISNIKLKTRRNPDQAIKYIQHLNKKTQNNFNKFFEQIYVYYKPFFSTKENTSLYLKMTLKENSLENLKKMARDISIHAIETAIYPSKDFERNGEVLIFAVSCFSQLFKLLKIAKEYDKKLEYILADQEEIWKVWKREYMKFDYWNLFDLKNKKWKFNEKEYIKAIKNYKIT